MSSVKAELLTSPAALKFKDSMGGQYDEGYVKISPPGHVQPAGFMDDLPKILDFQVRPDDVWVVTFPKCGTTWSQELVWLLMNDLDFDQAKKVPLIDRFPFLEVSAIIPQAVKKPPHSLDVVGGMKSPRLIKCHLPVELLPKQIWSVKPKIIYVARNAKDVVVSYYYHHRLWNECTLTLDEFAECFMENVVSYLPFWDHILAFWRLRNEPNILFYSYEDMKTDLAAVVRKVADFLERPVPAEKLAQLLDHLSFQKMRDNRAVNFEDLVDDQRVGVGLRPTSADQTFMRSGKVGDGRSKLSPEIQQRVDAWTRACLEGSGYDGPR
ncbi:luciferin sulfotransferase-like [Schistocerca serialis cubense]|uniref:luciferin sulfotransferase-like n=1 Tax=Schistocerca serialis cubense TaxID=2023355 RepID=UPI00214DFE04|nr:luciferin sulfotransferase-like [Schistocerca serialis cubense]XP_049944054.1 luciferin sulfotransferase-like [Schistocerca serialis cubense]